MGRVCRDEDAGRFCMRGAVAVRSFQACHSILQSFAATRLQVSLMRNVQAFTAAYASSYSYMRQAWACCGVCSMRSLAARSSTTRCCRCWRRERSSFLPQADEVIAGLPDASTVQLPEARLCSHQLLSLATSQRQCSLLWRSTHSISVPVAGC